ncbi:hypothetical protein OHA40_24125 [Nocardia sp. NBC_00508]|uniref:hypothetical protein n=1 Tax=Nocardia sp. NBC_00508 TaxID=2975992 RepID=UPI002E80C383|nr:hypothetical protein [Nocardia sp. NBC_00508]WUD64750.1 hypothetical protein OHA40_24125 [Nocardia sp. NBC_00508]
MSAILPDAVSGVDYVVGNRMPAHVVQRRPWHRFGIGPRALKRFAVRAGIWT